MHISPKEHIRIILVNGFFIDTDPWVELDSLFQEYLQHPYQLIQFKANSELELETNANDLEKIIIQKNERGTPFRTVIIAHSLGTYIVLEALLNLLEKKKNQEVLLHVEKVALFSIPLATDRVKELKSFSKIGKVWLYLRSNQYQLKIAEYIAKRENMLSSILKKAKEYIVNVEKKTKKSALIPVISYYSKNDRLTDKAFLETNFSYSECIRELVGDHVSILHFSKQKQISRQRIDQVLNQPFPHKNIVRISNLKVALAMFPEEKKYKSSDLSKYEIEFDHDGELSYEVTFAEDDIYKHRKSFTLEHSLGMNAFIKEVAGAIYHEDNPSLSAMNGRMKREKSFYYNRLLPQDFGNNFKVVLQVVNGFNEVQNKKRRRYRASNRNLFYFKIDLGGTENWLEELEYAINLDRQKSPDVEIYPPRLYYIPRMIQSFQTAEQLYTSLDKGTYRFFEPTHQKEGHYNFHIYNVRGGSLLLRWEILPILSDVPNTNGYSHAVRQAAKRDRNSIFKSWRFEQKRALARKIALAANWPNSDEAEQRFVQTLHPAIRFNISYHTSLEEYLLNTLKTCSYYSSGIDHLLDVLEQHLNKPKDFQEICNTFDDGHI